jgi:hypothetical protein
MVQDALELVAADYSVAAKQRQSRMWQKSDLNNFASQSNQNQNKY